MRNSIILPVFSAAVLGVSAIAFAQAPAASKEDAKDAAKEAPRQTAVARVAIPEKTDLPPGTALKLVEEIKIKLAKLQLDEKFPPSSTKQAKEDEELSAIGLASYGGRLRYDSKTLNVEEDSGIARKWFAELAQTVEWLSQFKREMDNAVADKNKKQYEKNYDLFVRGQAYFKGLVEKPQHLTKDQLVKIKADNAVLRKKYQLEADKEKLEKEKTKKPAQG